MERSVPKFTAQHGKHKLIVFDARMQEHSPSITIEHEKDGAKHTLVIPFGGGTHSEHALVDNVYALKKKGKAFEATSDRHFDHLISILTNPETKFNAPKSFKGEVATHAAKLATVLGWAKASHDAKLDAAEKAAAYKRAVAIPIKRK